MNQSGRQPRMRRGQQTFNHVKTRLFAAVFVVLVTSTVMIPGMASYLPFHQNDAVGLPILMFPVIWAGLFIYCFMESSMARLWTVLLTLLGIHGACIYFALSGGL